MFSSRCKALAAGAVAAFALAGCGGGDADASGAGEAERAAAYFMASNADEDGVHELESGVQYRVVRSGPEDAPRPDGNDLVRVHYEGSLLNGEIFDSSYERGVPAAMALDRLIPAWREAIPRMRVGDEWILWVPPEEGYGARGSPPRIPPHSVLVFRIELLGMASIPGDAAPERG